jgi:hypothetical protein
LFRSTTAKRHRYAQLPLLEKKRGGLYYNRAKKMEYSFNKIELTDGEAFRKRKWVVAHPCTNLKL